MSSEGRGSGDSLSFWLRSALVARYSKERTGLNQHTVVNQEATDVVCFLSPLSARAFCLPFKLVDLVGIETSAFGADFLAAVYVPQTVVDNFVGLLFDARTEFGKDLDAFAISFWGNSGLLVDSL